ncbi:MAG: hypothetical protein HYZ45_12540, partial [Burkholderiales bacterium]|nr:hypothetical protein [Burkholderiales bacterium]
MAWQDEVWQVLDIAATGDERSIKRAYAKRLKKTRPDDDPAGFQQLRQAYEQALVIAQYIRDQEQENAEEANDAPTPAPSAAERAPLAQAPAEIVVSQSPSATHAQRAPETSNSEAANGFERLHLSANQLQISPRPQAAPEETPLDADPLREGAKRLQISPRPQTGLEETAADTALPETQEAPRASASSLHISPRPQTALEESNVEAEQEAEPQRESAQRLKIAPRPPSALEETAPDAVPPETPETAETPRDNASSLHILPRPQGEVEECLPRDEIELNATPFEIANQLWQEFVSQHDVLQASALKRLLASNALLNLEVRDAFEFYCAQYCADQHADAQMRSTIVEVFGWNQSFSHLLKIHPMIPHVAMERYGADLGYQQLANQVAQGNLPLKHLLEGKMPSRHWSMHDRKFVNEMREVLHMLRWRYPEVIRHKLNETVVERWTEFVNKKRYYRQTLTTSIVFGLIAAVPLIVLMDALDLFAENWRNFSSVVIGQILAIGGFAWFSFHPPQRLIGAVNFLRDRLLYRPIHVYRYLPKVQLSQVPLVLLLPLVLFLPDLPENGREIFLWASVFAYVLTFYLATPYLSGTRFLIALIMSSFFLPFFANVTKIGDIAMPLFWLSFTYALLLSRTGPSLLAILKIKRSTLQKTRVIWLGAAGLMATAFLTTGIGNSPAAIYLWWLCICAPSFLLASIYVSENIAANCIFFVAVFILATFSVFEAIIDPLPLQQNMKIMFTAGVMQAMT